MKSDNWFFNESDRMPAGPIIRLSMLQNGLTLLSLIFLRIKETIILFHQIFKTNDTF